MWRGAERGELKLDHQAQVRTPVAVLGTLAEFHREPIPYDLKALIQLVAELHPDLLCLELTVEQWQHRDFSQLPPEYAEALLPLASQTDMVIVPVAGDMTSPEPTAPGLRGALIRLLRRWLAALQKAAPGPAAVNSGWRHALADLLYVLTAWLAGPGTWRLWKRYTALVVKEVLHTVRRDPGCRVLVVANARHCHHIRYQLRRHSEVEIRAFDRL